MREKLAFLQFMLIAVLLLPLSGHALAQTADKRLNYACKNTNLSTALKTVERLSGYYKIQFTYADVNAYSVSANIKGQTAPEAVGRLIAGLPLTSRTNGRFILVTKGKTVSQWISGTVTDRNGEPLVGASVWIKEAQRGAVTDAVGRYTINVKPGDEIAFSYLGMNTQKVIYRGGASLDVELSESTENTLNEVVVTGYQDIKKEKMTGAVSTIRADKLEERYTPNVMNNLEGRVAGLSTYGGKLSIRGTSSLYATTQPLLVVDGLPVEGSIEDLNPYDIESINVLKDAAASAIYGARASNGIIVITTKSAKKGGKLEIDFSTNLTVKEKRNVDYADNFYMNAAQQVKVESDYFDYYFFHNDGEVVDPVGATKNLINSGSTYVSPIQYAYYQLAQGQTTKEALNQLLDRLSRNNFAREYADAVYRRQVMQQYNLSLRSRSDKFQSNLTLNYRHDNCGQINTFNNQLNINYKGVYDVAKWLTATFSVNGVYNKSRKPGTDYDVDVSTPWCMPAYESLYNEDGSARPIYSWYNGNAYWDGDRQPGITNLGVNLVDEFYNNTQNTKNQHMRYHGELLFKLIDGLTLNTQFVYENDHTTTNWYASADSHLARTIKNAYATMGSDGKVTYLTPETGGMLRTTNTDGEYWTARAQANYTRSFGKHAIAAIAGLEFRDTQYKGSKALMLGYDDQLQSSATHTVDFGTLSQMGYSPYFMAASGGFPAQYLVFTPYFEDGMGPVVEVHHRYASDYINFTYTYDDKYNVFASYRKDYADVYGLNAKFRGKPLWSVGTGWNLHNEPFVKSVRWINFLKLRLSYGVTGNIYQDATSYMTATSTGLNTMTNLPYGRIDSPANPNLKWEQSRTTNFGVDFAFLDNRISGSVDFYNKEGKDIFSNKTLDPTTGFSSMFMNTASLRNRGFEIVLNGDIFRPAARKAFGWSATVTLSHNSNKITHVENPSSLAYQMLDNPFREGYPSSALWAFRFAGISDAEGEKGQTLWYVENGGKSHIANAQSVDVLAYAGQSEPKIIAGLDNRFTWNGFSLSLLLSYYGGHKMRALEEREVFDVNNGNPLASYFLNAWTPEHPTNTPGIGRYGSTLLGSEPMYGDIAVHPADFIKIRNIVFGYDLPHQWLQGLGINRVSLRFQIDNPKYLWVKNKVHVDPETLGLRNPSSYIFGLNLNL